MDFLAMRKEEVTRTWQLVELLFAIEAGGLVGGGYGVITPFLISNACIYIYRRMINVFKQIFIFKTSIMPSKVKLEF